MDIDYGPDRRLFRSFSMIKGYDGYMIGKLSCHRICQNSQESVRIRKQRKNFVILELQREEYLLTMTLLCPRSIPQQIHSEKNKVWMQDAESKMTMSENVIARHSFTTLEIINFVEFVQDENGIHRTADPVVPGLLMAEWFFSVLHSFDWNTVEIRFHMPAYAGQNLCLCKQSERYICISEETGQLFWTGKVRLEVSLTHVRS